MRNAVVVSTWSGNPSRYLFDLCESLNRHPAGTDYALVLSANGLDYSPPPELAPLFTEIFIRENTGYNLGAWDHAWRRLPGYDYVLFLQDDCVVLRDNWLQHFIRCFESTPNCGLVGETLQKGWGRPWAVLTNSQRMDRKDREPVKRAAWASFIRQMLAQWSVPEGPTGLHITSVVHFTSRSILEEVDGYNLGRTKEEVIAAEIGFSRKIEALGYTLVQIGRRRHTVIGHRQWPRNTFFARMKRSFVKRLARDYWVPKGQSPGF